MTKNTWELSEADRYAATRSYITYATGMIALHDPTSATAEILHPDFSTPEGTEEYIVSAEVLMWRGLSNFMRYANDPKIRRALNDMETTYAEAYPRMEQLLDWACDRAWDRLEVIHDQIPLLRPLPLSEEPIYKHIAHGRKDKVKTLQLLADFSPSSELAIAENRKCTGVPRQAAPATAPVPDRLRVIPGGGEGSK